jgi:hypothetical protein
MESDAYTGLLNVARDLKNAKLRQCGTCMEERSSGYLAQPCGAFVCAECIGKGQRLFKVSKRKLLCEFCQEELQDYRALLMWVSREELEEAFNPQPSQLVGSAADAWNFTLVHGYCQLAVTVAGWEDCDSTTCPRCGKPLSVVGPKTEYSTQMKSIQARLATLSDQSSASDFAALHTDFPNAWNALHFTELVNAIASGVNPDLSYWPPQAVTFLKTKAKEIQHALN